MLLLISQETKLVYTYFNEMFTSGSRIINATAQASVVAVVSLPAENRSMAFTIS